MHKKHSVTFTHKSTTSNPKQGTTGLHKYVQYQSHTLNGSPVIIRKPSVTDVTYVTDVTFSPSVTAKCPPPLRGWDIIIKVEELKGISVI